MERPGSATPADLLPNAPPGWSLPGDAKGRVRGAPLPFGESVILIWPHLTGLLAGAILLFALAYILFQRQEIRA